MHANQKSTPRRAKHPKQPGKWRSHKKNGVAAAPKGTKNNLSASVIGVALEDMARIALLLFPRIRRSVRIEPGGTRHAASLRIGVSSEKPFFPFAMARQHCPRHGGSSPQDSHHDLMLPSAK